MRLLETEAYLGSTDAAAHSYRGITPRTKPMFEEGGILYVYFIYGMHWCANIVTEGRGLGHAVLLRAGRRQGEGGRRKSESRVRTNELRIDGPARLVNYLGLTGDDTGRSVLTKGFGVYEDSETDRYRARIQVTPRIGITKAADLPLRFVVPPALDA